MTGLADQVRELQAEVDAISRRAVVARRGAWLCVGLAVWVLIMGLVAVVMVL